MFEVVLMSIATPPSSWLSQELDSNQHVLPLGSSFFQQSRLDDMRDYRKLSRRNYYLVQIIRRLKV
jgi:hypothetical protein